MSNGTATVRTPYEKQADDPETTNDESNDQPLGNMGTISLRVRNVSSGNRYPLDADVTRTSGGYKLLRLYFVKGGWVDFDSCNPAPGYVGHCTDENRRRWDIEGK
ncbi:MAG: hypothetical protein IPG67_15040 [Acidobacteria bacterium]|nr:hypothetical protein [Acidobacteriota bacterium]